MVDIFNIQIIVYSFCKLFSFFNILADDRKQTAVRTLKHKTETEQQTQQENSQHRERVAERKRERENACKRAVWKSVKRTSAREQEQIAGCGTVGSVDCVINENLLNEILKSKLLL